MTGEALSAAGTADQPRPSGAAIRTAVAESLEHLRVTDLVYEEMWHSGPLIATVTEAVASAIPRGETVLVVGGNLHLLAALRNLGYHVEAWRFVSQRFEADPEVPVSATIACEAGLPPVPASARCIVLCLTVEKLSDPPIMTFRRLRTQVTPSSTVVVAVEHGGRLGLRMAGLRGRGAAPAHATGDSSNEQVSWNLPLDPTRWWLSHRQWAEVASAAGFAVQRSTLAIGHRAYLRAPGFSVAQFAKAVFRHRLQRAVPALRDYCVMTLGSPVPEARRVEPAWAREPLDAIPAGSWPRVSVLLPDPGAADTAPLFAALSQQTYPTHLIEVLMPPPEGGGTVVSVDPWPAVRFVPGSRLDLIAGGVGEILVSLPAQAIPTPFWIESAVTALAQGHDVLIGSHLPTHRSIGRLLPGTVRLQDVGCYDYGNVFFRRETLLNAIQDDPAAGESETAALAAARARGARVYFLWVSLIRLHIPHHPRAVLWAWADIAYGRLAGGLRPVDQALGGLLIGGLVLSAATRRRRFGILALPWLAAFTPEAAEGLWPPHHWGTKFPLRLGMRLLGQSVISLANLAATIRGRRQR